MAWGNDWNDQTQTATETFYETPLEWTGLWDAEGEPIYRDPPPVCFTKQYVELVSKNVKAVASALDGG